MTQQAYSAKYNLVPDNKGNPRGWISTQEEKIHDLLSCTLAATRTAE